MKDIKVGLQLYFLKDRLENNFKEILKEISQLGFDGVEFAGSNYGDFKADEFKKLLNKYSLKPINNHFNLDNVNNFKQEIEFAQEIEMDFLTIPILLPDERKDVSALKQTGKFYKKKADLCQNNNIRLCYHNHGFDLDKLENEYILDHFIKKTDNKVKIELDNYFVMKKGIDLFPFLEKRKNKIELLHFKDIDKMGNSVPVGEGLLDLNKITNFARDNGIEWVVVDLEPDPKTTIKDAKISINNIRKFI